MSPADITLHRCGAVDVLALQGDVDIAAAPALEATALVRIAASRAVVLDLTGVRYLDSGGMRLVDRVVRRCQARTTPIVIAAAPGSPARGLLEMCAFPADLLAVDLAGALEAVSPG